MSNPRITAKEWGLLKGALRRVFFRSQLRKEALQRSIVDVTCANRPRVKKWSRCPVCDRLEPTYKMEVDHLEPLVPLNKTLQEMSMDDLVDRLWCDVHNLLAKCNDCHKLKTAAENKERRRLKALKCANIANRK